MVSCKTINGHDFYVEGILLPCESYYGYIMTIHGHNYVIAKSDQLIDPPSQDEINNINSNEKNIYESYKILSSALDELAQEFGINIDEDENKDELK